MFKLNKPLCRSKYVVARLGETYQKQRLNQFLNSFNDVKYIGSAMTIRNDYVLRIAAEHARHLTELGLGK